MTTPLVSIIVPCYNQAKFLPETLDSVLAQTYKNWECIIVNDGSVDNTEQIAIHYCNKDIRFKYIKQENQGLAQTRNNGIKASNGYYILPLDADDKIGETYLEIAVHRFTDYPETTLVYCNAELFGTINQPWDLPDYNYSDFIWRNSIFCTAMYKKTDYDKTKGYNPNMKYGFEDWDFWLSLLNEESVVYRINKTLFFYRQKNNSMTTTTLNNIEEIYMTIFDNHNNIYQKYCSHLISYKNNAILQNIKLSKYLESIKQEIYNTLEYRIGAFLLKPLRNMQNRFTQNK